MKFQDQLSRTIELQSFPPKKIVSVVPSQTELLSDFGLDEEVIGITKFCVHPEHWFRNKVRIGGTKKLNISLIKELKPDLIIANKEENLQAEVELLAKEFPVWISDISNLNDAYEMIEKLGELTGKTEESAKLLTQIKLNFEKEFLYGRQTEMSSELRPRAAYLIWKEPYMAAGGDTFISEMMNVAGFQNALQTKSRYPEVSVDDLTKINADILFLSSEPYPFSEKHAEELQSILPQTKIKLVDGEMFSWYGSRLLLTPAYLRQLRELVFNS